jgi:trk system potassium uptake protein TrkH
MSAYDAPIGEALRDSFFQVVSMSTTTGYARSAYTVWPAVCQILLITVMFIGGCGASTSGSIKVIRVLVMFKVILRGGIKRLHPRSVVAVKIGGIPFPAPVVSAITVFILTYMFVFLFSTVILSLQGLDMSSTATAALAMLSNTGIGFGETTSVGDFSCFNPALKLYLCALMVVGRLEMFPIIILFTKNFWGKDR